MREACDNEEASSGNRLQFPWRLSGQNKFCQDPHTHGFIALLSLR